MEHSGKFFVHDLEMLDVAKVDVTFQDIFNRCAAFLENRDDIFQGLLGLQPYIALSRNFAFFVPSNLPCRKDHLPAFGSGEYGNVGLGWKDKVAGRKVVFGITGSLIFLWKLGPAQGTRNKTQEQSA